MSLNPSPNALHFPESDAKAITEMEILEVAVQGMVSIVYSGLTL
jgi:hypothetical protein